MKIGIVGSRRRLDKKNICDFVRTLDKEKDVVVSGGCKGVDKWAVDLAKRLGMKTEVFLPILEGRMSRWEIVQAYYARNKKIAKNSDMVVAFVMNDRTGGTENTLEHCTELSKPTMTLLEGQTTTRDIITSLMGFGDS